MIKGWHQRALASPHPLIPTRLLASEVRLQRRHRMLDIPRRQAAWRRNSIRILKIVEVVGKKKRKRKRKRKRKEGGGEGDKWRRLASGPSTPSC